MNQGRQANLTGKYLEDPIRERIISSGYKEVDNKQFSINTPYFFNKLIVKHCYIGKSIYGTKMYTDILLYHNEKHPNKLAIECKWQQVSGSVDEKFPYIIENIKYVFPCPCIIVLDGGGYKRGAKQWLERQVDDKFLGVYSLAEFIVWANKGGI